jgi:hypothetical protein
MSFLSSIGGLLQQYAAGSAPAGNVEDHFDQAAQTLPASTIASGLAEAFRSGQTPPFAQMAAQLFANGNGGQQASMINTLLSTAGPQLLQSFLGNSAAGGVLGSLIQGGQTQVTPEQAANVTPDEVQALAEHVNKSNPSIVDRVSEIYARHPTLIKSLGAIALAIAMKKMSDSHNV